MPCTVSVCVSLTLESKDARLRCKMTGYISQSRGLLCTVAGNRKPHARPSEEDHY